MCLPRAEHRRRNSSSKKSPTTPVGLRKSQHRTARSPSMAPSSPLKRQLDSVLSHVVPPCVIMSLMFCLFHSSIKSPSFAVDRNATDTIDNSSSISNFQHGSHLGKIAKETNHPCTASSYFLHVLFSVRSVDSSIMYIILFDCWAWLKPTDWLPKGKRNYGNVDI